MKKKILCHYGVFKTKAALPFALLIASVILLNAASAPFGIYGKKDISFGAAAIEIKSELGRIYGVVNMPVKIVNAMLEKRGWGLKIFSSPLQETITSKNIYSVITAALPKDETTIERTYGVMANSGKKQNFDMPLHFLPMMIYDGCGILFSASGNEHKLLLLFLVLMRIFARGSPIRINKIKIEVCRCVPALINLRRRAFFV
ncbi:MAG: hypothetical protein LBU09_02365 [Endomicrobium sp.]|jgi:hypothetical protein|nr:hypothetical protein [Endomicrobium sp.]